MKIKVVKAIKLLDRREREWLITQKTPVMMDKLEGGKELVGVYKHTTNIDEQLGG